MSHECCECIDRLNGELISVKLSCPDCNEIRAAWQSDIAERDTKVRDLQADLERYDQKDRAKTHEINVLVPENNKLYAELESARERIRELEARMERYEEPE